MDVIIKQVMAKYKWDPKYAAAVASEYQRFLVLRNENNQLSPSDDIDKFWHQHLLNTKHYLNYCYINFGHVVHHDPTDACDQRARILRLTNTVKEYIAKYGRLENINVWAIPKLAKPVEKPLELTWYPGPYVDNLLPKLNIKIIYTFDERNNVGEFSGKKWRANNMPYNKKVISYYHGINETIDDLRHRISEKTGHNHIAIQIYESKDGNLANTLYQTKPGHNLTLSDDIKLSSFSNKSMGLMCVLEEMSHMGYC